MDLILVAIGDKIDEQGPSPPYAEETQADS